jgi:glycosyltransferase involved in cell wall biosynthesis
VYKRKKISVYFPCRNEANHLHEVLARVPKFVDEVIVVSNKSTDKTVAVARKLGAKTYEDNRDSGGIGYGFAHMTGIAHATGDIIVGADGDATYPIEDLGRIIDYLSKNHLDFVSCNRYPMQKGTRIPFKLRFGVWLLNMEILVLYGVRIQDTLSGMWVLRREIRNQLNLTMGEWNLSPQIKLSAATNASVAFGECSIAQHQRMGATHQSYYKTGLSHAWWILKNRFAAARPAAATVKPAKAGEEAKNV